MIDIRLERDFRVSPQRLFAAITSGAELVSWWGPESCAVTNHQLDFTTTGPWFAEIGNDEGDRWKMSGQVTHVDPPRSVGFTWGWHDLDTDERGAESFVTLTVAETSTGSRLIVDHRGLADAEVGSRHEQGWLSSIRSLTTHLNPPGI